MATPKLAIIPDILEEHYEEIQYLWGHRRDVLRSPRHLFSHVAEFEERLEAHVQGLLLGRESIVALVEPGLSSEDTLEAFSSAYAFLRPGERGAPLVLAAFSRAQGPGLRGLTDALCHGPARTLLPQLQTMLDTAPPLTALACAEILSFHGFPDVDVYRLDRFLQNGSPEVRYAGWRLAGLLGASLTPNLYGAGMRDDDPAVRRAALYAAAWGRQEGVLNLCRYFASQPSPENLDALGLLAILGRAEDLKAVLSCAQNPDLGPSRFAMLGSFGHPATITLLLEAIAGPDPETAAAAGAAFTKMTGHDVASNRTAIVNPAAEGDEFEKEFAEEIPLPDPQAAFDHWSRVQAQLGTASRLCAGFDLGRGISGEQFAAFSMESRWEAYLRGRFEGGWSGYALQLELLQKRG